MNWCKHTYRAWGIGLFFTALFGGGSYFAVDQAALHFWHTQLALWIPAASAGGVGLVSLIGTWRAATWCDAVLCVPMAAQQKTVARQQPAAPVRVPLGAALQSAAVGPDPSKAATAKPVATTATAKPAANPAAPVATTKVAAAKPAPAPASKTGILGGLFAAKPTKPAAPVVANVAVDTVGVIFESTKLKIETDARDQDGFSTVTVTTTGIAKRELTGQGGLFVKVHQVPGVKWAKHKGLGDGRKQITGRVNPAKRQDAFNQLVQLAKQFSA